MSTPRSIDTSIAFRASRYDKSLDCTADYLNCPLDKPQYEAFLDALLAAESVPAHIDDDRPGPNNVRYFEACLPIEEIARRGRDTLRFGPMKPMGLTDPRTGRRPYAVVQLRQEDARAGSYNLVGFQNHMRFGDQQRVLRMIPGLEHAEFLRFGQVHRNTYINGPALLAPTLQMRTHPEIFLCGPDLGRGGLYRRIDSHWADCRTRQPPRSLPAILPSPSPLKPRWDPCAPMCRAPIPSITNRRISPSTCCPSWENPPRDKKARYAEVCRRGAGGARRNTSCVHV